MHGAGLEVKRSPMSGIIIIFVTFQNLYFSLGSKISHAPHTYIKECWNHHCLAVKHHVFGQSL